MARPRLYLSSYLFGDDRGEQLRWDPVASGRPGRAAIIMNALDVFGATRLRNWEREARPLEGLGYAVEELDLREYIGSTHELVDLIAGLDLVWVVGGNAFWLARVMHASGFAGSIRAPLAAGTLSYAGYSAGACVAGPDLRGIDLMDDPDSSPDGGDAARWTVTTLCLVPYRIVPHWHSEHAEAADAERARSHLHDAGLEHRCIRDGGVLVVE